MMERIGARKGTWKSIEADTKSIELAPEKRYEVYKLRLHRVHNSSSIGFYTARPKVTYIFRERKHIFARNCRRPN